MFAQLKVKVTRLTLYLATLTQSRGNGSWRQDWFPACSRRRWICAKYCGISCPRRTPHRRLMANNVKHRTWLIKALLLPCHKVNQILKIRSTAQSIKLQHELYYWILAVENFWFIYNQKQIKFVVINIFVYWISWRHILNNLCSHIGLAVSSWSPSPSTWVQF